MAEAGRPAASRAPTTAITSSASRGFWRASATRVSAPSASSVSRNSALRSGLNTCAPQPTHFPQPFARLAWDSLQSSLPACRRGCSRCRAGVGSRTGMGDNCMRPEEEGRESRDSQIAADVTQVVVLPKELSVQSVVRCECCGKKREPQKPRANPTEHVEVWPP